MCGLFGVHSSVLNKNEIAFTEQLGVVSLLRGMHSTGLTVVHNGRKGSRIKGMQFDTFRKLGHSVGLLQAPNVRAILDDTDCSKVALIGHCRHATLGEKTIENAHPIHAGNIIGTHNGTVHAFDVEDKEKSSDSHVLFQKINKNGLVKTLNEMNFRDAFALVYIDRRERTLNFIRNSDRPLWFMENANQTTAYWASEEEMLKLIAARDSTNFKDPWQLKIHTHVILKLGKPKQCEFEELKIRYKPLSVPVTHFMGQQKLTDEEEAWGDLAHYHGRHPITGEKDFEEGWYERNRRVTEEKERNRKRLREELAKRNAAKAAGDTSVPIIRPGKTTVITKPVHVQGTPDRMYSGFRGELSPINIAEDVLNRGCSWCSNPANVDTKAYWVSRDEFICGDCSGYDDFVKQYCTPPHNDASEGYLIEYEIRTTGKGIEV